jgi:tRNA threonylcarbamoyladenosine biosynthesis protein TsaB
MRILGLDAALARCSAAILEDGRLLAERVHEGARGYATTLPVLAAEVLAASGLRAADLDAVAATVGPGSFTGLRAALALAHGLALAAGRPAVGVTVAEALSEAVQAPGRLVWVAIDSRRGRLSLDRISEGLPPGAMDESALPAPPGPVAVAGDAAPAAAARLAARGADVLLTDARLPLARHVAAVGARRLAGALPPLTAQPAYLDPPEAKLPAGGLRPPPAGM